MTQWEYAALVDAGTFYFLEFYKVSEELIYKIAADESQGENNLAEARNRTIAQLGIDGWELVSQSFAGIHTSTEQLLFKRPLVTS